MEHTDLKHNEATEDEARTLTLRCAQANADRRLTLNLRMGEGARDVSRLPRRLVAAN